MILLPQISSILRFFIYKNLKIARSRAYALTVASRGKPSEFWSQVRFTHSQKSSSDLENLTLVRRRGTSKNGRTHPDPLLARCCPTENTDEPKRPGSHGYSGGPPSSSSAIVRSPSPNQSTKLYAMLMKSASCRPPPPALPRTPAPRPPAHLHPPIPDHRRVPTFAVLRGEAHGHGRGLAVGRGAEMGLSR